jgi:hypothetical protein
VSLLEDLERIVELAAAHAAPGDAVVAVIPTEPVPGARVYLCAFDDADGYRSWLALETSGQPVTSRRRLRESISIAALCEAASEAAGGGDVDALLARLEETDRLEAGPGLEDAEKAALVLRSVLAEPPQLATPARLDEIGAAARRLEQELDPTAASPFTAAMRTSEGALAELEREVIAGYRAPLD